MAPLTLSTAKNSRIIMETKANQTTTVETRNVLVLQKYQVKQ